MIELITRRRAILTGTSVLAGYSLASVASGQATQPASSGRKKDRPPPLPSAMVREFVGAAHGNLDRTREMLAEHPTLINATWDWGDGDFETGLGGASHMGRADIAVFLLEKGARMDVFAAAMLGRLEIVKAACAAFPNIPTVPGPHGITLIEHARKGGEPANAVLEFLQSLN